MAHNYALERTVIQQWLARRALVALPGGVPGRSTRSLGATSEVLHEPLEDRIFQRARAASTLQRILGIRIRRFRGFLHVPGILLRRSTPCRRRTWRTHRQRNEKLYEG